MSALTCLFIGRFQPFHKGHLLVIKGMTKVCGRIVIAIGSANEKPSPEHPFTVEERKEMIQRALQGENIIPLFDVSFVEVPDQASDAAWAKSVLETAGEVHMIWTGNEATRACFEGLGIELKTIKEVPGISGKEIRSRLKTGGDWRSQVPDEVAAYLSEIHASERV